jgi:hypothetical protein
LIRQFLFTAMRSELRWYSNVLILRGASLFVLGAAAVAFPENTLIPALIAVAFIAALTGLYEITEGIRLRPGRGWLLVACHGLAAVVFGLLTSGVAALHWSASMISIVAWLLCYIWMTFAAASVWRETAPTKALIASAVVNVAVVVAINLYPYGNVFALLYFGAAYAAALGAWTAAIGWWLRRHLPAGTRSPGGRPTPFTAAAARGGRR